MKTNNRREFLKKSIISASAAAFIPGSVMPSANTRIIPELPFRKLGRTGIKSPLISMGAGMTTNPNFVKAAYNSGIKLFFSASYYREGNTELMVGEALKEFPRDSYIICTSANMDGFDSRTGTFTADFNPDAYRKKAEDSLKRFGLDYVDIFLLPMVCKREHVLYEPVMNVLKDLKKSGKAKYIGIATHDNCEEGVIAAADAGIYDVIMIGYNYKLKNKETLDKAIDYAAKAGLGIIGMKSTAGAFRDKSRTNPLNTNAALKWVLQNPNISTIVSGMSTIEEMNKNLAMINDIKMSDEEVNDLKVASLDNETLYCQQCKVCVPQCPHNIDIPAAMRSYMYAYGYRDLEHAQFTLNEIGLNMDTCNLCEECRVNCVSGFNIKEKIQDIARLKDVPVDFIRA